MLILGINFGHEASATIIQNGRILAAIEEEKVSRIKQDFGWPRLSIDRLFAEYKLEKSDVDIVAIGGYCNETMQPGAIDYYFSKAKRDKYLNFADRIFAYSRLKSSAIDVARNEEIFLAATRQEGFINAKVVFHKHHLCHAASAYYASPIDVDLVVTCDGHGDGESFNFYTPTDHGLNLVKSFDHSVSIGQFYGAITHLLGFKPTRHEGKITGLAAYGRPTELVDRFYRLWSCEGGTLHRYPFGAVDAQFKELELDKSLPLKTRINVSQDELESVYHKTYYVLLGWLRKNTEGSSKEDIAFACQRVTERIIMEQTTAVIRDLFGTRRVSVALAGGVFSNVRVNQKLYELEEVANIFVQPAMGDSGVGMGAAMLSHLDTSKADRRGRCFAFKNTYWGPDYASEVPKFISDAGNNPALAVTVMEEPAKYVARKLADNCIVGFWEGRMEWGPRALGARTIMLNTFDRTVNDSLNKRLDRTEFMPFAPVVLDYMAKEYFPSYDPSVPAADYMTITYDTAEAYKERLQAVVHVDGTARPQVIRRGDNEYYYDILDEFCRITGCGSVVNTSFNAHEEPIVSSPEVSLKALLSNRIDALVVGKHFITLAK